jgi:hypothetical protein
LSELEGFTMLTGSRLGAAFVVLVVAVVYALRAGEGHRRAPVSTAVLALTATALVYIPAAGLGAAILAWEPYAGVELRFPAGFVDLIDLVYGPVVDRAGDIPAAVVFLAGIAVLLLAFKLIDAALPDLDDASVSRRPVWLRRKWPMFALGSGVALVTMSVSVALTILVPLVGRNVVRREYVVPYIMGANITTLADTLVVAMLQRDPAAAQIVLAEAIGVTLVSLAILAFWYQPVKRSVIRLDDYLVASNRRLIAFVGILFLVPVSFLLSGLWIGPLQ